MLERYKSLSIKERRQYYLLRVNIWRRNRKNAKEKLRREEKEWQVPMTKGQKEYS